MPDLSQVPEDDQGIDRDNEVRPGVYTLKELSTGEAITENGAPVYVDENGNRVEG